MNLLQIAKRKLLEIKGRFWETELENMLWIVDIMPSASGFSIAKNKIQKYFFILNLSMLIYIYGGGNFAFLIWYAATIEDVIPNYLSLNIAILTVNVTHWWIVKWPLIQAMLTKVRKSDELAKSTDRMRAKHNRYLTFTKRMVITFYVINLFNGFSNYYPQKLRLDLKFSMVPCVEYFFIVHLSLMVYIYGGGNVGYLIWYAVTIEDFIKNYVSLNIAVMTLNVTHWWIMKWSLIQTMLEKVRKSDDLAKRPDRMRAKHNSYLTFTKRMVIVFYIINLFNGISNYFPHKLRLDLEFAMVPCIGMPLTSSPYREICSAMTLVQEACIVVALVNYQAFLILLFDHTSATFHLLADEIMILNTQDLNVREQLSYYIQRHALILDIINDLKSLYTSPIGVNFASNAVCMAMFFYLPIADWIRFLPVMVYCFMVFFLYCFLGQKLVDGAEVFERAVYSCGWEKFGWRERKMVYLMLVIAQQKVELLAGDIVPVNYYTFATTLQGLFKFVTVVKF